ncbi:MAG: radical SAM protein [Hungatella sp.]|nr:radical SAM protein [Hungatella sp.]
MRVNFEDIFEFPITISWELTADCNYRCIHCRMDDGKCYDYSNELSINGIKKILMELQVLGIQQINYSGGEPFCRSDFLEILKYTSDLGFKIGITSNGSFIDASMSEKLFQIGNIDLVQISLDGCDKKTHDFIRGVPGAYDGAIDAIKNLKNAGIRTGAVATVMNCNKEQIEDILQLLLSLGVDTFGARRFMPVGHGSAYIDNLVVSKEDYFKHCIKWSEYIQRFGDKIQLFIEEPLMGVFENKLPDSWIFSGCIGGTTYGAIMAEGEVRPCIFLPISLGNLREKSFREIWSQNEIIDSFKKKHLKGECAQCPTKSVCGGCRAMAYLQTGDINATDPLCFKDLCNDL